MKPATIQNAFKATGIYLFDRNVFSDDDFRAAEVSERPDSTLDPVNEHHRVLVLFNHYKSLSKQQGVTDQHLQSLQLSTKNHLRMAQLQSSFPDKRLQKSLVIPKVV